VKSKIETSWHGFGHSSVIMKNLIKILIVSLLFTSTVNAQDFEKVKNAISISSAKEISRFFDNNVEITIDGKTSNYSKTQAEFVIKDFFKSNPATKFEIIHKGNSQGGLIYAIGKYSANGKSYRTLVRMRDNKLYNLSFTLE